MDIWEKLNAAQRMQDYIHQHFDENITLEEICKVSMYSKWHSFRIFKELFNKTPFEYIRALRRTNAARKIKTDSGANILDVALDVGFDSHEGFTKAFQRYFGVNPGKYRGHIPRSFMYFEPSSVVRYHLLINSKEYIEMSENQRTVTVTVVEKPNCKLILKRGKESGGYFEFCEEIGCDAFEILETVPQALEKAVFLELPPGMITPGTSKAAAALEVPFDFNGDVPEGFEIVDLPSHFYMWFNGAPYEDESMFGAAHEELYRAIANYKPELYGYEFAPDSAPIFNSSASAVNGVRQMIPVKRLPA